MLLLFFCVLGVVHALLYDPGEDGSSHQKRIDFVVEGSETITAYGMNGGPFIVESLEQLRGALVERGLASTLHVLIIIPQAQGAPCIPLIVDSNSNSFSTEDVQMLTRSILSHVASKGLAGRIFFDTADGDSRLRLNSLQLHDHEVDIATAYFTVDHPLITLRLPRIDGHGIFAMIIDWMYTIWRLRLWFLTSKRVLMFGSRLIISGPQGRESLSAARIPARLMLLQPDLEERNKQHWPGVLRMCFLTAAAVVINPDDDMLDRWFEAPGCAAMSQYWRMVRSFVIIFVSITASFQQKIEHAGYVLGYFALWRR